MKEKSLMYFSAEGQTFYVDNNDMELDGNIIRDLMLNCDYCFYKNKNGHWQFAKNRTDGDWKLEYFDIKDLLAEIPLHTMYQNRKTLNRCQLIISPTHAHQVIEGWRKARVELDNLRTPWYDK